MAACVFPSLARTCHRKGQGRVPHLASILSATVFINRSQLPVCHLFFVVLTVPTHSNHHRHHTPPRALPLRERTWIAHSAPVGRLSPNVVAWLRIRRDLHLLPLPLPPIAAQLLPPPTWTLHTTRCKGRRAFGDCLSRFDFEELPLALSIRSRGRETPRRSSRAKADTT